MKDLKSNLFTAVQAALAGGAAIMHVYNNEETKVVLKDDKSPLTQADQASNAAIMRFLEQTDVPVLSEEGKAITYEERKHWSELWIVDPLDGTKEFIKRNGEFTVNVALVHNGAPVLGVIYVPVTGEMYLAAEGIGAYKTNCAWTSNLSVSLDELLAKANKLPESKTSSYTIVGSRSHMTPETEAYIQQVENEHGEVQIISKGSSLKICMVAEGRADVYPRFAPTMEWDTAAGHAIAKYAGFEMKHHNSDVPLSYNKEDLLNPWFIVK
jgi:3'(2'), 5'-bisphosphate nucleotidase